MVAAPPAAHVTLLGDPPADLSGVMAVRAVIGDFEEQHCDGSGDPSIRAALDAELEAEVLRLATSADERAAVVMPPRPGRWHVDCWSDARDLTQEDTDELARSDAWHHGFVGELAHLTAAIGQPAGLEMIVDGARRLAQRQRGGISSDPLVRLLAFRAWGRRDIDWPAIDWPAMAWTVGTHYRVTNSAGMTWYSVDADHATLSSADLAAAQREASALAPMPMSADNRRGARDPGPGRQPPVPPFAREKRPRSALARGRR